MRKSSASLFLWDYVHLGNSVPLGIHPVRQDVWQPLYTKRNNWKRTKAFHRKCKDRQTEQGRKEKKRKRRTKCFWEIFIKSFELHVIRFFLLFGQLHKVTVEMAEGREGQHLLKYLRGIQPLKVLPFAASSKWFVQEELWLTVSSSSDLWPVCIARTIQTETLLRHIGMFANPSLLPFCASFLC